MNELQQRQGTSDDKKKVMEMLERLDNENEEEWEDLDSDDDDEERDLADRLAEVDLNNADEIWEQLTDAEKQEFKSIVYNGEIEKIVQRVEPWWKQKLEVKRVQDLEEEQKQVMKILKQCPRVITVKNFDQITTKPPAPCIIHNIANVIAAYCFIFRYYNGDHASYELEAADNFISITENLKTNANFEAIIAAVDSVMLNCHSASLFCDLETKKILLEDVEEIFAGPGDDVHAKSFILSALSDAAKLLKVVKKKSREKSPKDQEESKEDKKKFSSEFLGDNCRGEYKNLENQSQVTGCIKKLEFYVSFVKFKWEK